MSGWKKLGQVFVPQGQHPKLSSHAANPLAVRLEGDVFRVFYSGRDDKNRSSVGAVDIELPSGRVVCDHAMPFFQHGPEGSFYGEGVSIGCVYQAGGIRRMLFMGWQNPPDAHWRGDIGSLVVTPDLRLDLEQDRPFLGADRVDPISLSYPWVMQLGNQFHMWYGTTVTWDAGNGEMLHVIAHAVSDDGKTWQRKGQAIPHQLGGAQAFSRPTVAAMDGRLWMWFSYRSGSGQSYRIGAAISENSGQSWRLALADAGIDASSAGWDSQMICYPFVFWHADRLWMLYNGNGYGATGFGLAAWEG